jgi:hypothetical protein
MRNKRDSMPDSRYEGMTLYQDIVAGNRVWKVYDHGKFVGEAESQSLAEQLWLAYKFGGKHSGSRIGDVYNK